MAALTVSKYGVNLAVGIGLEAGSARWVGVVLLSLSLQWSILCGGLQDSGLGGHSAWRM